MEGYAALQEARHWKGQITFQHWCSKIHQTITTCIF